MTTIEERMNELGIDNINGIRKNNVFITEPIKLFAKQIVQYQKFKTSSALEKMNLLGFNTKTAKTYFNSGVSYIKYGKHPKNVKSDLTKFIDYWVGQKLQPLTPSENDKRKQINTETKEGRRQPINSGEQVKKVLDKISTQQSIIEKSIYGVKLNNKITVYNTEIEAKAYMDACKELTNNEYKIIRIKIEEINI